VTIHNNVGLRERGLCPEIMWVTYTRVVCKVHGLAAVRRCYAKGGGDCYAKL
jgi:hypothetical protein